MSNSYGPSYGPSAQTHYARQPPPRYYQSGEEDYVPMPQVPQPPRYGSILKPGHQVEVRIRGNFWVVGLLVSGFHLVSSYFGHGYDVEYTDLGGRDIHRSQFRAEDIRPYTA
ncbi:hypothetical protein M422DRAFT_776882 [Sphaerobolus stellatus SS14]|nr:hypothetical protein M422DRAFT_776882 [Sphaerobolus stellatus SS14]